MSIKIQAVIQNLKNLKAKLLLQLLFGKYESNVRRHSNIQERLTEAYEHLPSEISPAIHSILQRGVNRRLDLMKS